ncbi:type II toxin-antitoxin system RelE/ParE family toxin [Diaphorobacter nitroreducens]|uniref:type II toxin-antitoxin system RelE/ParE family toxin n=1 Tax=Diaphorobacter nitroreducens TaxID=164759 RepID=UPI0035E3C6BE
MSFAHKGIEAFFKKGAKAGIQAEHAPRLARQLAQLNRAQAPRDMNLPGWKLHPLSGELEGYWAVMVGGNWRLTFQFDDGDAIRVCYPDYH